MAHKLKIRMGEGKPVLNGWLAIPCGFAAELMATCGWDSLTVDLQHGLQDYGSMVGCLQAIQAHPVTPIVRVPWLEPGIVGKALDAGAQGLICPMINTRDDSDRLVRATKYPPLGQRSNGPVRAVLYGGGPGVYQKAANEETLVIPMIETREAVDNLEAILDVPGIDGVYVGPTDIAFSYGLPPVLDTEDPTILKLYDRLIKETSRRGQFAGIHTGAPAYARRMMDAGFGFITIATDGALMTKAARESIQTARSAN